MVTGVVAEPLPYAPTRGRLAPAEAGHETMPSNVPSSTQFSMPPAALRPATLSTPVALLTVFMASADCNADSLNVASSDSLAVSSPVSTSPEPKGAAYITSKPDCFQTSASASVGTYAVTRAGLTSGKSPSIEDKATMAVICALAELDASSSFGELLGLAARSAKMDDAGRDTVGIAVNTSGLIEVTLDGALMAARFAQASRAPAAMVVQPSRMVISVAPAGTRRRVVSSASYRSPSQEERCALPASTEIASTPAQCEKADASTSSALSEMRTAPCLPPGMSRRRVRSAP